ncbi:MAG: hypothetical protein IPK93_04420 [Solirubrobacterales bacterium]|nr:hypothetical protein [Solirubrobacterales bacterium]
MFTPNGDCRRDQMAINFRTTQERQRIGRDNRPNGGTIRLLEENRFFKRYREHTLVWDGKKDNGHIPKTERYRVRVTMKGLDRVLYLPGRIHLRNVPAEKSDCVKLELGEKSNAEKPKAGGS